MTYDVAFAAPLSGPTLDTQALGAATRGPYGQRLASGVPEVLQATSRERQWQELPHAGQSYAGHPAVMIGVGAVALALSQRKTGGRQSRGRGRQVQRAATVFIDGAAGTTGLQVRDRLDKHPEIQVVELPAEARKDEAARKDALRSADAAVLCLPDDAAKEAVAMCEGADTIIVDASTAHRIAPGWTYGFPELTKEHKKAVASSKRIANPGCYPTGFIGLIRPLVDAGILPQGAELNVHAVSGYSGGGKALIGIYEGSDPHEPWGAYGFNLDHKHLPEMKQWTGLNEEPIFCPSVSGFAQGMCVSVPLRTSQLSNGAGLKEVQAALAAHYEGQQFVTVAPPNPTDVLERGAFMRPDAVNDTNKLELFCFGNESKGALWLMARLDNLGKGASGACVQNLNLALGFDEAVGL
eukprot:TRINITY_DN15076_c0_g1_i1.p1 TRINITY_DN15076_c0_g1~~TRINITY_DN15076_c0_g1_i1.p1  ORF type:complete len:410 (-),score=90.15 TRINITY_DN15076_c0_g1_i1:310-1539(-)